MSSEEEERSLLGKLLAPLLAALKNVSGKFKKKKKTEEKKESTVAEEKEEEEKKTEEKSD